MTHRLSNEDRERRDKRIEYLMSIGSSRVDIGRAYGLSPQSVTSIIRRRKLAGKLELWPLGQRSLCGAESVGGIS
jgi:CRP-like cAMP-binding protein